MHHNYLLSLKFSLLCLESCFVCIDAELPFAHRTHLLPKAMHPQFDVPWLAPEAHPKRFNFEPREYYIGPYRRDPSMNILPSLGPQVFIVFPYFGLFGSPGIETQQLKD